MKNSSSWRASASLLFVTTAVAACAPRVGQSVTPAPAATVVGATAPAPLQNPDIARHGYTAADVRFMQHMIAHHAQALAMTSLVPGRTTSEGLRLLAERIDVSQKSEISMMERWLRKRGEVVPNGAGGDMHHTMAGHDMTMPGMASGTLMPGMLTPAQMDALTKSSGPEFERLFLQGMIQHHEGALVMVGALFATQGAGQEPEIFGFATDVDASQRAEIRRMRALLGPGA